MSVAIPTKTVFLFMKVVANYYVEGILKLRKNVSSLAK